MLGEKPAGANIPVKDVEEARRFYEGVVGATVVWSNEGKVVYRSGGTHMYESAGGLVTGSR
jgi:catechol 2,3-dioxygenase-like lactoylglutathione lyase family enzyme